MTGTTSPSGGRLSGEVALVTGGAAGIGRAICLRFAEEGAAVVVGDVDVVEGARTAQLVRDRGGEARFVALDVADEGAWTRVLDEVATTEGTLDVLVNNAGLPYRRELSESVWEEWQRLTAVNAGGTFLGLKHGGRVLAARGGGAIVNVSSAAALVGVPAMTSYSAGKGAIRAMSRAAARELAPAGVRVNTVFPSSVRTAMVESDARDTGVSVTEFVAAAAALSPLGRIGEPRDVADAALFLAGHESRFVTGAELVVDGGTTAGVG